MKRKNLSLKQKLFTGSFIFFTAIIFLASCTNTSEEQPDEAEALLQEKNQVDVMVIQQQDFTREIISNGKLSAIQRAELYFNNPGIIDAINVRNGIAVSRGEPLASVQDEDFKIALEKARVSLERAEIDRLSDLMGMGYRDVDEEEIPPERMRMANIRSGYNQAMLDFQDAQRTLDNVTLTAPFSGKVEGLQQKPFEMVNQSQPFCTLINDERFTIEFPLLETEISEVQTGQQVTVTPVASDEQTVGTITEINPRIDENGLVWLKAEVDNPGGYLEGMNVKVSIKKSIPNKLVVPKQAVVLRQNREVLFRYTNGISYWTYVNVTDENESQYAVQAAEGATLEAGDTVIISNNLNLAHDTDVEIN